MRKILLLLVLSIILTLFSLLIVRVIPFDSIKSINIYNHLNTITISIDNVKWWENIRGFPFPMISTPVIHNSSELSDYSGFYNIIFYFFLSFITYFIYKCRSKS